MTEQAANAGDGAAANTRILIWRQFKYLLVAVHPSLGLDKKRRSHHSSSTPGATTAHAYVMFLLFLVEL